MRILSTGRWQWLLVALVVEASGLTLASLNYRQAFAAVGIPVRLADMVPALLASHVVSEVAPVGWAAGSAVFIRFATRRGHSASQATLGTLVAQAADLLTFSLLFGIGIAALFRRHELSASATAGVLVLLVMNLALIGGLALAIGRPASLGRFVARLQRCCLAITGKAPPATLSARMLSSLLAAGEAIREEPRRLLASLGASAAANVASVLCLFLVCEAFRQPVTFAELITGFGTGTLTWMVSPIPAGLGIVEAALALALTALGVPSSKATLIAVGYRGVTFWLPFLLGLFALHRQSADTIRETPGHRSVG